MKVVVYHIILLCYLIGTAHAQIRYAISGAGPGGLFTALELIAAGVTPDEILLLEARSRSTDEVNLHGKQNPFGSRPRPIIVNEETKSQIKRLGVADDFLIPVENFELSMPERGAFLTVPYNQEQLLQMTENFLGRQTTSITYINELERALLKRFEELGGKVHFNTVGEMKNIEGGVEIVLDGPKGQFTHTAEYAAIFEGENSATREALGVKMQEVKPGSKVNYLGLDFRRREQFFSVKAKMSQGVHVMLDKNGKYSGYGFITNGKYGGSFGILLPPGAEKNLEYHKRRLLNLAKMKFEVTPEEIENIYQYSTELKHAETSSVGRIIFGGDTKSTANPESGEGANGAARDAKAIGEFERSRNKDLFALDEKLARNSRLKVMRGLEFRELVAWFKQSSLMNGAWGACLVGGGNHGIKGMLIRGAIKKALCHMPKVKGKAEDSIMKALKFLGAPVVSSNEEVIEKSKQFKIHPRNCERPFLK